MLNFKKHYFLLLLGILILVTFHFSLSLFFFKISFTNYLNFLHNQNGIWNFALDVRTYIGNFDVAVNVLNTYDDPIYRIFFDLQNVNNLMYELRPDLISTSDLIRKVHLKYFLFVAFLFGFENYAYFLPVNTIFWSLSCFLIFYSVYQISQNVIISIISISIMFFPSILFNSTQIFMREPYLILGVILLFYLCVSIYMHFSSNLSKHQLKLSNFILKIEFNKFDIIFFIKLLLILVISLTLILAAKSYFSELLSVFLNLTILSIIISFIKFRIKQLKIDLTKSFFILVLIFANLFINYNPAHVYYSTENAIQINKEREGHFDEKNSFQKLLKKKLNEEKKSNTTNFISIIVNKFQILFYNNVNDLIIYAEKNFKFITNKTHAVALRLGSLRDGFFKNNITSGSQIDTYIRILDTRDLFFYFPRASQIGLFAPFPNIIYTESRSVGSLGIILSVAESLILSFVVISSFIIIFLKKNIKYFKSFFPIIFFSLIVIILLGYVIPNFGTIYRMKVPFFIPIYLLFFIMLSNILRKKS